MNDNRRIRIFVSSTFRDMMGERDELMTHAWPELRRFCRERQVELVEVDLRWGSAEEQSRETLKLCLNEISACQPFSIGVNNGDNHEEAWQDFYQLPARRRCGSCR